MRPKRILGFQRGKSKTKFPLFCFSVDETFRLYHRQQATSVLSVLYTLCCVRSNQYRPHVVSMGHRCDTVVSDEYKNAGKQTILIFWQFLNWGAKFVILNWPLWDKNWSLTWACVSSILAPAGALLFSISQHFTSNISPNTSNIFENILLLNFTCDQVKVGKY